MDLSKWKYLFKFGNSLFIHAKGAERVGVNGQGKVIVRYRVGPDHNPRCQKCLAARAGESHA